MSAQKTILVANPCDAERSLLKHALQSHNLDVIEASCAKEVVGNALTKPIDVILLDTLNWESPSLASLGILKNHARTCGMPVVFFGQPQNKEQVAEAIQKGAAAWIGRQGFELSRFVERIIQIATERRSDPPLRARAAGAGIAGSEQAAQLEKITPESLQQAMAAVGSLPAFEFSLTEAITATAGKDKGVETLAGIVERDPGLALAILAATDAGEVGEREALDLRASLARMGPMPAYKLIENMQSLRPNLMSLWDVGCWWVHSVATARIAALLSRRLGLGAPAAVSNAGLLHEIGYFVLANYFPKHYGALFSAAGELDSIQPQWEKNLIGAHHGEIGEWVLRARGIPSACCEAVQAHHAPVPLGQTLTTSSRVMAMVLQAADLFADALLPADPPLSPIANLSEEFENAFRRSGIHAQNIIDEARKVMAELLTEMSYLFPQSTTRSFFYRSEPLGKVAYFAAGDNPLDLLRIFFQVRSDELVSLDRPALQAVSANLTVINLTRLREPAAQLEALTSLLAVHAFDQGPGAVLLPTALPPRLTHNLIPPNWRMFTLPVHASRLVRWMASQQAGGMEDRLSVA